MRKWWTIALLFVSVAVAAPSKPIVVNDVNAGAANREAIMQANERMNLSRGIAYVSAAPVMTIQNVGLTMSGIAADSTIKSTKVDGDYIDRSAMAIRCGLRGTDALSWRGDPSENPPLRPNVMPPGQVGWLFDGSDSLVLGKPNIRILSGDTVPSRPDLQFMRAYKGVPFTTGNTEFPIPPNHGIVQGETIFATDGPYVNECVGEFRRVMYVTAQTVTIDQPLARKYTQGTFVRGPFPVRMNFQNTKFEGQYGSVIIQQADQLQFSDCDIAPTPAGLGAAAQWFSLIGCSRCELRRCKFPGLGMSSGTAHRIVDCVSDSLKAEQCQIDVIVENCRIGWMDTSQKCDRWTILNCEFSDWFGIYDEWTVIGCRNGGGPVYVRGRSCRVTDLKTTGPVIVQGDYQGHPENAATDVQLNNVDAGWVEIGRGTSGRMANIRCVVVCRDEATRLRWTRDGKPLR